MLENSIDVTHKAMDIKKSAKELLKITVRLLGDPNIPKIITSKTANKQIGMIHTAAKFISKFLMVE